MRPQGAVSGVAMDEIVSIINISGLPGRGFSACGNSGLDFEGRLRARGRVEPELGAVVRDRGRALATKSVICA